MFAIYGVKRILEAKNQEEVAEVLKELFKPVAPSMVFTDKPNHALNSHHDRIDQEFLQWHHLGNGFDTKPGIYKSERTNRFVMPKLMGKSSTNYVYVGDSIHDADSVRITFDVHSNLELWNSGMNAFFIYRDSENKSQFRNLGEYKFNGWQKIKKTLYVNSNLQKYFLLINLNNKGALAVDNIRIEILKDSNWNNVYFQDFEQPSESIKFPYKEYVDSSFEEHIENNVGINNSRALKINSILEKSNLDISKRPKDYSINYQINKNLLVVIPTILSNRKFKNQINSEVKKLKEEINQTKKYLTHENEYLSLGNLINCWNAVKHFYPYQENKKLDWDEVFIQLISEKEDLTTGLMLKRLIAFLDDGHGEVYDSLSLKKKYAPFLIDQHSKRAIIEEVLIDSLQFLKGHEIISINDIHFEKFFEQQEKYISASNANQKKRKLGNYLIGGLESDSASLILKAPDGTKIDYNWRYTLTPNVYLQLLKTRTKQSPVSKLGPELVYIDASLTGEENYDQFDSLIKNSDVVIIDGRKKPSNSFQNLIGHFFQEKDTTKWMYVPKITIPDYNGDINYKSYGWEITPSEKPYNGKIFYLIGGKTFSYGESVAAYFQKLDNVTLIGKTTAGANGNVNSFILPGGFTIRYTGMKVLKHDGSQLHGIGIIPDIHVERTPEGIAAGKDEVLEKAIELATAYTDSLSSLE